MAEPLLRRLGPAKIVTVAASGTTSDAFALDAAAFGNVYTPASLTSTALTFTVCDTVDGTFVPLVDSAGNAIAQTVAASKNFALPAEIHGCRFGKLVCGSSEAATRTFVITLKG